MLTTVITKMINPLFIVVILTIACISFNLSADLLELEDITEWKYCEYRWKKGQKDELTKNGIYNASACVMYDVDADNSRVFVTMIGKGAAATVGTVLNKKAPGGNVIKPYPDWTWYNENNKTNCEKIIRVYRVHIKCNHIFILDSGTIEGNAVCDPKLLIFELTRDKLVKKIIIPPQFAKNQKGSGLLVTPYADIKNCRYIDDATIYMADTMGFGLVIYNKRSGFCRIESDFMKPTDPDFTIKNERFHLDDGILGLTRIHQALYYTPLAGLKVYKMNILDLQQCQNLNNSQANSLTELTGTLSNQTGPIASKDHVLFFSNVPEMSILCVDATSKFDPSNTHVIAQDSEKLPYVSGLKVIHKIVGDRLMILSNNLQLVVNNKLDITKTNFRMTQIKMETIRNQTECFLRKPKPCECSWLVTWLNSI